MGQGTTSSVCYGMDCFVDIGKKKKKKISWNHIKLVSAIVTLFFLFLIEILFFQTMFCFSLLPQELKKKMLNCLFLDRVSNIEGKYSKISFSNMNK